MQHDEVIWQIINQQFCSFKIKTDTQSFCRNEYNVTGLCNRQSCPLANSQYATVREHEGSLYLYKKVIERAHMPAKMWEKIKLSNNVEEAKELILKELEFWPKFLKSKCLLRFERISEVMKRMRRLENDPNQPILTIKSSKKVRRDRNRENRAIQVARLETTIEKELMDRLQKGVYGEIYNFNPQVFEKVLEKKGGVEEEFDEEDEEEYQKLLDEMGDDEFIEAMSDEEDEEEELQGEYEYEEELDEEELEGLAAEEQESLSEDDQESMLADLEDLVKSEQSSTKKSVSMGGLGAARGGLGKKRKRPAAVEIEYETEGPLPTRLQQRQ